jgi:DNA-binding MarR family transcriptional regulator
MGADAGRASPGEDSYGFELPLLLFGGFRAIIDELHAELARRGHQEFRPAHGFALQAVGMPGATATEVGRRLGVSKQAAGKTLDKLEQLGYVARTGDDADRRRKIIRLTPRGVEVLTLSAVIFEDIRRRWRDTLGADREAELEDALRRMVGTEGFRLDVPGWFGAHD